MHMDPQLPTLVGTVAAILAIGIILRRFHQPHVVAYLIAGVIIGRFGLGLLTDTTAIGRLGDAGVVVLLFFVGMELSFARLIANWRVAVIGTLLQILLSIACVWALGLAFGWTGPRIVLVGFVISLSSTAVVFSILREWNAIDSQLGSDAVGIIIVQDLLLIPMLIALGLLAAERPHVSEVSLQLAGGALTVALVVWLVRRGQVSLPFSNWIAHDHQLQVFAAFLLCFGFAYLSGLMRLSSALGAFVAGYLVASARQTDWVKRSLDPFHVVFVALFFVSIGMLIDLEYVLANVVELLLTVVAVLLTNTLVNALIVRVFGRPWAVALFTGAILGQIGEFSFVLAALGRGLGLIGEPAYQMTVAVITLSLALSPAWIRFVRALLPKDVDLPGGRRSNRERAAADTEPAPA